ncbi:UDP-N-acetylglucosamine 1-carboxyvinyltransferase [Litorimonas cladophorae]|uniref:UDP-N-acetylglucosamine 1-carboxyvinyltransferase n=1 Tax=Litorimonas cladophorae TaxID=1220491 RepID=A0A918KCR8_9PROT|nr:UDP-N-acetylglucosamine 1-carboxyvinyltransferase [Litorimonas cladophorae]GGX58774.1 UDP-N-acetylglucosamine 1-carboxyvinyltransferase [Litorimonas cladophorae]
MDKIVIEGGFPLNGEISISGAKNSAIKLMAVCLLTDEPVTLTNMPRLRDTRSMAGLLRHLGVEVDEGEGDVMQLHAPKLTDLTAPYDLVRKMRASFNVLGPLLARERKAKVSLPGGCAIGARPVDLHLKALEALGADIKLDEGYVIASAKDGLKGGNITFPFVSVGATEHAMLAAVLAEGETVLNNAAREPEIADLANCLNAMGAKIMGAGRSEVRIQGVERLSGVKYAVVPDRIEAGTYALAAATAGGSVRLTNIRSDHLGSLWPLIAQAGAKVSLDETSVLIERGGGRPKPVDVDTMAYPGFPTDLQAQFMAFMCLADGTSIIRENIFENRFMHCPELIRMGADITVRGREAIVRGVKEYRAAPVMATDLRASACLINAGLAARGETHISRVYHLDRGFEKIEVKLQQCGARISRQKDD